MTDMSVYRKSLPIVATSFVNKSGAIGLSLLPMLLVEKQFSSADASVVMAFVKSAILFGTVLGGIGADRFGVRVIFLTSFFCQGLGLLGLPFMNTGFWLAVFGMLAQLGNAFFSATARLLLKQLLPRSEQQESFGWLRAGNNLGQVISFSLGALFSGFGTMALILFDSVTSFVAFTAGLRWVPTPPKTSHPPVEAEPHMRRRAWRLFFLYALFLVGFEYLYELYMVGTAARFRLAFGDDGLRIYSTMMLINTILCTGLAVPAARYMRNPRLVLPFGLILLSLGGALTFFDFNTVIYIYIGALLMTFGEIIFASTSQYVQVNIIPGGKAQGTVLNISTSFLATARILAASTAFPLVVYADHAVPIYLFGSLPFLGIFFYIYKQLPSD